MLLQCLYRVPPTPCGAGVGPDGGGGGGGGGGVGGGGGGDGDGWGGAPAQVSFSATSTANGGDCGTFACEVITAGVDKPLSGRTHSPVQPDKSTPLPKAIPVVTLVEWLALWCK